MTRGETNPQGKILFIGGGIANFTNVAATFKGIIRALNEFKFKLQQHGVRIFVRRAGPNYQEGLKMIRNCGNGLGVEMQVYGPEMHVSGIVPLALLGEKKAREMGLLDGLEDGGDTGRRPSGSGGDLASLGRPAPRPMAPLTGAAATSSGPSNMPPKPKTPAPDEAGVVRFPATPADKHEGQMFTNKTRSFVYGMQPKAVQGMLDFDYMCNRLVVSRQPVSWNYC
jgi:ATP citrate (pro-S)-lyase